MQIRGKEYLDQMPKTLYECFPGGEFSKYFNEELTVETWVKREHLEEFFIDCEIKKNQIKPLLKSKSPNNEIYWLDDENDLIFMLENYISFIKNRNIIYQK